MTVALTLRSVRPRPGAQPLTGMRRLWSEGKTVFPYTPPKPAPEASIDTATLEDLIGDVDAAVAACQRRLNPANAHTTVRDGHDPATISRQAYDATSVGVLSLDAPSSQADAWDDEPGTIGALIPADHPIRSAFRTVRPVTELTDEERAAHDAFIAEHNARRYGTVLINYTTLDPLLLERIEREREHVQTSPCITTKLVPTADRTRLTVVSDTWFDTFDKRNANHRRFTRYILDLWGRIPTIEDLDKATRWYAAWKTQIGYRPEWYRDVYLAYDEDPYREALAESDDDLHHSYEWYEDPITEQKSTAPAYAECRSPRCPRGDWHTVFAHRDFVRPEVLTHWRGKVATDLDRALWHSKLTPPTHIGSV